MTSDFSIIHQDKHCIVLQDMDGPKSITNDAERVSRIMTVDGMSHRLFYFDTYGDAAEITPSSGHDIRLTPLRQTTVEEIREYVAFGLLAK